MKARVLALLASVRFWGGFSALVSLVSLALPWWGIETSLYAPSWGVFWGPAQPASVVVFFSDRLDRVFSGNYSLILSLVVLTSLLTVLGSYTRRWPLLTAALLASAVTDLTFIADIEMALNSECQGTLVAPASCISGLVGSGISGSGYVVTWGFKTGFYLFIASGLLILATLMLQRTRTR